MLYPMHEMGRNALMPMRMFSETQAMLFKGAFNPWSYTAAGRRLAAACNVFRELARRYPKPAFNLGSTVCDGETVPVHEAIVERKPFAQLKHFVREAERPQDPRLLIIAPLSGHFATLLRNTVETLLPEHDVYITDWRNARMVPAIAGPFGLDDFIDYVIDFVAYLGPDTHVLAVCQPAVAALAATALMAEDGHPATPRSLSIMGGPIDARIDPTTPNRLATDRSLAWFRRNMIHAVPAPYPGVMRSVYPGFLQLSGFISMNIDRHMDAYWNLYRSLVEEDEESVSRHKRFYDEYLAVMDLPATFYLDTIERVFQKFDLARGHFSYRGRRVNPGAIRDTALFTIEGENDDICSPGQTEAAHSLCPSVPDSRRQHHVQHGVGHYGVFNGRHWRREIAPQLRDFIRSA